MVTAQSLNVLVIDDDPQTRLMFEGTLSHHHVKAVANATEAMNVLRTYTPNVVVMDILLPDTDGFRALRELQASWQSCATIAITGYYTDDTRLHFQKAGFDGYLFKPLEVLTLQRYVEKIWSLYARRT